LATSNPAFSTDMLAGYDQVYGAERAPSTVMTLNGAIGKTFLLLAILTATAIYSWNAAFQHELDPVVMIAAAIGGAVLAMITIFKPTTAPWIAPVYAAFEGVFLGALSFLIEHGLAGRQAARGIVYPGLAMQAVALTCGTLFVMLFIYRTGLIRVTHKLYVGITAATGAVCLFYMAAILVQVFGGNVPLFRTPTPIGIGIGLVIVGIAAFNLLIDFDFMEKAAESQAPKYMEWYTAFGLILTLVWLYLEILQLLRQFYDRRN
jgi:uncharacterized YccA/Bax inhibitor family protein